MWQSPTLEYARIDILTLVQR